MTFLTRVATFAAMSFSLAGLIGTSTPSLAADLAPQAVATPAVMIVKPLTVQPVPVAATPVVPDPAPIAEDTDFDSLDDAVAAQHASAAAVDEAVRCLAGAVYFESKGEPLTGQLAVAEVIINRANSGRFPPDVCAVVTQRGQFGFVRGGRIPSINEAHRAYRTAVAVARVALADAWDSAASTALYFNTPGRAPGARLRRIASIGNHVFYR